MPKKKKFHYYVLVFTNTGPVYVTSLGEGKTAYWNREEKPYELGKYWAESVCMGLNINGYSCVMACMPYELDYQPYLYSKYECTFTEKEDTFTERKENENE